MAFDPSDPMGARPKWWKRYPHKTVGITDTPDYAALINSDPAYMAFLSQGQQVVGSAAAQRRAALRNIFQQYGALPGGFQDPYGDLDESTRALAEQNPFSGLQNLARNFTAATAASRKALAARGALRSGETGYEAGQLEQQRANEEFDLNQSALQALSDALQGFTEAEAGAYQGEGELLNAIRGRLAETNPVTHEAAKILPGWSSLTGHAVYKDSQGRFWTRDKQGQPVAFDPEAWKNANPALWARWQAGYRTPPPVPKKKPRPMPPMPPGYQIPPGEMPGGRLPPGLRRGFRRPVRY